MFSIGAMGAGQDQYYAALAREDYYREGGEPLGRWWGAGTEELGLSGTVKPEDLRQLFQGYSPTGKPLVQNAGGENRRPGVDGVFSPPRTADLIWAMSDPRRSRAVQESHTAAVRAALTEFEKYWAYCRTGRAGQEHEAAKLVIALYDHGTSRNQDMNLHTHCLILNVCVRPDGSTGALELSEVYKCKMLVGALYRSHLSFELEARLGVTCERKKSWFEVRGVPQEVCEQFSTRRQEIMDHLAASGREGARAAAVATLETREVKEHLPREVLFAQWQAKGRELGFGPEEARALLANGRAPERDTAKEFSEAFRAAVARVSGNQSHFSEKELIRAVAEEGQCRGLWAARIVDGVRHELAHCQMLVPLGRINGELRYTTRENLESERRLLARVDASTGDSSHLVGSETVAKVLSNYSTLTEEQALALLHLTLHKGSIQVVTGMAGTGKGFVLNAAREAWEQAGFEIRGAALAGKAAQGLAEGSGIGSATIHKTLLQIENGSLRLSPRTICVVDEAGMVPTRLMDRLTAEVQKAGAKLVLVGDAGQLQPVEAGGPFRAIAERLGDAKLTQIIRQRDEWAREAVHEFARGDAAAALTRYAERGLLRVADDRKAAVDELVAAYKHDGLKDPRNKLILAGTNKDAQILNEQVQRARLAEGLLGIVSVRVGQSEIYANDRVLFTRNSSLFGVMNGSLGTVEAIEPVRGLLGVALDNGKRVRIPLASYDHVKLAYCTTTWKAQGATVERAFVLTGGETCHRELAYVDASRARDKTLLFTDRSEAGNDLTALARRMSKSRAKDLAHDVLAMAKSRELALQQQL